jgi:tetratricopeptide (TPR) repeat protein
MDKEIEEQVAWTAEPEIIEANSLLDRGKLDKAAVVLNEYLATHPESFAAWNLLRAVYWRTSKVPAYREATGKLCELHLKAHEWEAAWHDYETFLTVGGEGLPPSAWLNFCRMVEQRQDFDPAMREYENLAAIHPSEQRTQTGTPKRADAACIGEVA